MRSDTLSHAYELMKVEDPRKRRRLAKQVAEGQLSLVKLRERIEGKPRPAPLTEPPPEPEPEPQAGPRRAGRPSARRQRRRRRHRSRLGTPVRGDERAVPRTRDRRCTA